MSPKSMLILGVPLAAFFAFCVYMAVDSTHYLKPFDPRENNRAEYDPETAEAVLAMVKGARLVNVEGDSQPTLGAYLEQLGQVQRQRGQTVEDEQWSILPMVRERWEIIFTRKLDGEHEEYRWTYDERATRVSATNGPAVPYKVELPEGEPST
ncbi:MAG: hypothetical protein H6684_13370 [Deltaproteobacteria bacterium]|nr:hypothetical protein [Deltaproteobacteria bacterium]